MAVRISDALSEILGDSRVNIRIENWLWIFLRTNYAHSHPNFNKSTRRDEMARIIADHYIQSQVIEAKLKMMLPDNQLSWISEENRQLKWITRKINESVQSHGATILPINPTLSPDLIGRAAVIARIDTWNTFLSSKSIFIQDLENQWAQHIQQDSIFKWFKTSSENDKASLAWQWLNKHRPNSIPFGHCPISSYQDILEFFDSSLLRADEKLFIIASIKKSWSQIQYRNNLQGKKQSNHVLSETAIKHLGNLSKKYNISKNLVLEILIDMEIDKADHIPEKLRRQKIF